MKKIIFKTLSILVVGFFIAGTSFAQENIKEEIKKESKITIKIVKDGETVIDSTFEASEGMDHEKIQKLINKFSGEEVHFNWIESSGDQFFNIHKGKDSKSMKMKFFSDQNFNFEFDGEAFGDSAVFIWNPDSMNEKMFKVFGDTDFSVFEEIGKHGNKVISIRSISAHSHGKHAKDHNVMIYKNDDGDECKTVEIIISDDLIWTSGDNIIVSDFSAKKEQIELKSVAYGVYRLEFNSEELEPILIEVFNSEGKRLFKKKVKNFYGRFIKEIELEDNEISFYSVRVVQGDKEIIGEFEYK